MGISGLVHDPNIKATAGKQGIDCSAIVMR